MLEMRVRRRSTIRFISATSGATTTTDDAGEPTPKP